MKTGHRKAFELWKEHLHRWEGHGINIGIAQVDTDKVYTNQGIREDTWNHFAPSLFGINPLDSETLYQRFRHMTKSEHDAIVKVFWDNGGGDLLKDIRIAAFMAEINWGGGRGARKAFQSFLNKEYGFNLVVDGWIGRNTAHAFNSIPDQSQLFINLVHRMDRRYKGIATGKKEKNLTGWLNRLWNGDPDYYRKPRPGFYKIFRRLQLCSNCGETI